MFERHIKEEIESFLEFMPVTLITGARQTGKTTLVESIAKKRGFSFYTFDDEFSLSNARRDPSGWLISLPKPAIIDEVQRLPEIFLPMKKDVDENRKPGRFLLTGSANPLLLPKLGDSLAGRMGIVTMYPFSQGELRRTKEIFISYIFGKNIVSSKLDPIEDLFEILLRGGFPTVQFLEMQNVNRWVHSYLQTIMERDVRDLSNVEGLKEFPKLFQLLATRSAQFLNVADISRSLGMVNVTVNRYIRLLETLFFIYLLPAWYTNLGKRIIKAPKLHLCDTAILSQLLGVDRNRLEKDSHLMGQFLESFIFSEIQKLRSWSSIQFDIYHFRDGDFEVDLVLEKPDQTIVGIEVKNTRTIHGDDLKGLRYLKKLSKNRFKRGIILHPGTQIEPLGDDLWAFPIQAIWSLKGFV